MCFVLIQHYSLLCSLLYSTRNSLFVQWYVSSISKDIADFYLHIRDDGNKILLEKILAYDTRIGNFSTDELERVEFSRSVDLCILARNSNEQIVHISDNQCTKMPKNLNEVIRKYNRRPSTIFKVYEMDKNDLGRNAIALMSGSTINTMLKNNILIYIALLSALATQRLL
jgi:hypothetical protein